MKTLVRTQWHHIRPLLNEDEVYLTAPSEGKAIHWGDFNPKRGDLRAFMDHMDALPKFVISDELMELAKDTDYAASMLDMKKAGVLRLPFPAMIVEFKNQTGHSFVLLREHAHEGLFPWEELGKGQQSLPLFEMADVPGGADMYGVRMSIEKDGDGHYFCLSPSIVAFGIHEREGAPWVALSGEAHTLMPASPRMNTLVQETYRKDSGNVFFAAAAAYLLMATFGIEREVVRCEKLNKHRVASGKNMIPEHSYVYIKRVYRSGEGEASDTYDARKSPRPHWRRGHLKNIRYGEGRKMAYAKFIPGRLVAYAGGPLPGHKQYMVRE